MTEEFVWPAGKTFGELTPDQKKAAARQAGKRLEAELTANADAISRILGQPIGPPMVCEHEPYEGAGFHCLQNEGHYPAKPHSDYTIGWLEDGTMCDADGNPI